MSWWYQWFMPAPMITVERPRVVAELACDGDCPLGWHARDGRLPRRRVGHVVVVARGASAAETAVESVVRTDEIEHRRDESFAAGERHAFGGHVAKEHVAALVVFGEMLMRPSTEIRERDRQDLVAMFEHAEVEGHVLSGLAVFCFKIPTSLRFILTGPTLAHRALRHGEAAGLLVDRDGLPRRSIRARCVGEIALPHVTVGHVAVALAAQSHQQR